MSVYSLPGLVMGLLVARLARKLGKKRLAFAGGIVAGCGLFLLGIAPNLLTILLATFGVGAGISVMFPALAAVFEDYFSRLEAQGNYLLSLMSMSQGLGYIIGPSVNGVLAQVFGPQLVFSFWGVVMMVYSGSLFLGLS